MKMGELVRRFYAGPGAQSRYLARQEQGLAPLEAAALARWCPVPTRLLDLGCGAGREAVALERLGHQVVAVDTDPALLRAAHQRLPALPFVRASIEALPFADGSFGAALAWSQLLGQVDGAGRAAALAEARRVLADGGVCIVTVHERTRTLALARDLSLDVEHLGGGDVRLLEGGEPVVYHYFERAELRALLAVAELSLVWYGSADELGDARRANLLLAVARRE